MKFIKKPKTFVGRFFSVFTVTGLSRLSGFLRELVFSSTFGANYTSDVFFLALRIPSLFKRMFGEGPFNSSFLPIFSRLNLPFAKGKERYFVSFEAYELFKRVCLRLCGGLIIILGIWEVSLPWVLPVFFKTGSKASALSLFTDCSQILAPYIFFIILASFYGSVLNSFSLFEATTFGPVLGNILCVLGFGAVGLYYGPESRLQESFQINGKILCSWVILVSGALQLMWVLFAIFRHAIKVFPFPCPQEVIQRRSQTWRLTTAQAFREFFRKFFPAMGSVGVSNLNILIGMSIAASLPEGAVSYLNYGDRVQQLPLSLIGVPLGTILLPHYTHLLLSKKEEALLAFQHNILKNMVLVIGVLTFFFLGFSQPVTALLYGYGRFSLQDVTATSHALMAYSLGLPAYFVIRVLNNYFFVTGDMGRPLRAIMLSILVDIALSLSLSRVFGHVGIALAASGAAWFHSFILAFFLKKSGRWKPLFSSPALVIKVLCFLGGALGLSFLFCHYGEFPLNQKLNAFLYVSGWGLVYLVGLLILGRSLKLLDFSFLKKESGWETNSEGKS